MMKKKIYLSCPAEKRAELNAKAKVLFSDHVLVPKVTQANLILCVGTPDSTQDLDLEVGQVLVLAPLKGDTHDTIRWKGRTWILHCRSRFTAQRGSYIYGS